MKPAKSKYSHDYCCNDCERGFTNRAAWEHHGAETGHDINGDLPGKHDRELAELRAKLEKLQTAYDHLSRERARMHATLSAIDSIMFVFKGVQP